MTHEQLWVECEFGDRESLFAFAQEAAREYYGPEYDKEPVMAEVRAITIGVIGRVVGFTGTFLFER